MSKIILKNKKNYFNIFFKKNNLKNNRYYTFKHPLVQNLTEFIIN